jgi:predicted O-methyltransferase YrrM
MGRIIRCDGPAATPGGRKVFLATPAYADLGPDYAGALFEGVAALGRAGIGAVLEIYTGHCHVDDARNRLVRDFLMTDCTDLFFLDADIGWRATDLVRLMQHPREVVGGVYPVKRDPEEYPVELLESAGIWTDKDGLIEVDKLPTGFLRIQRVVIEAMDAGVPHFCEQDFEQGQRMTPVLFERTMSGTVRFGGDYEFCRRYRAMGGHVYLDPYCQFKHVGPKVWSGSYATWLERMNGRALLRDLTAIWERRETAETYQSLVMTWGNPWSVPAEELAVLVGLVRATEGPILECGSGISTLAMAAAAEEGREIWVLENDAAWMRRLIEAADRAGVTGLQARYAPLQSYGENEWYQIPNDLPEQFGLIFCDGPARCLSKGSRNGFATVLGLGTRLSPGGALVMDDADAEQAPLRARVEAMTGGRFHVSGAPRPFAVLRRPAIAVNAQGGNDDGIGNEAESHHAGESEARAGGGADAAR